MTIVLPVKSFGVNNTCHCRCRQQSGDDIRRFRADSPEGEDRHSGPHRDAPRAREEVGHLGVSRELVKDQGTEVFRNPVLHDKLREPVGGNRVRDDTDGATHWQGLAGP